MRINKHPHIPVAHPSKNIDTTIPMWTIDEYAIMTFISLNDVINTLDIIPPTRANLRANSATFSLIEKSLDKIKPKPPNFNNTPAKIIEPITGASTWALGNHKWNPKQGSLTINPNIKKSEIPALALKDLVKIHE